MTHRKLIFSKRINKQLLLPQLSLNMYIFSTKLVAFKICFIWSMRETPKRMASYVSRFERSKNPPHLSRYQLGGRIPIMGNSWSYKYCNMWHALPVCDPKDPYPSLKQVWWSQSHPHNRIVGLIPFLRHIWMLTVKQINMIFQTDLFYQLLIVSKNILILAILLVTFLGWWKRDPFEGCWWPPTFGDKKGTLNHLDGTKSRNCLVRACRYIMAGEHNKEAQQKESFHGDVLFFCQNANEVVHPENAHMDDMDTNTWI